MAKKYISVINNGTEDFEIKDSEAREAIANVATIAESQAAAAEITFVAPANNE